MMFFFQSTANGLIGRMGPESINYMYNVHYDEVWRHVIRPPQSI